MAVSRSYSERHSSAVETFEALQGNQIDGERAAQAWYRRHGALGSLAIDVVMGDVWSRSGLSKRDRSLIVIAALASRQAVEELGAHALIGLFNGLTRQEIDEILLHVAATNGFPSAIAASRIIDEAYCRHDGIERQPMRTPAKEKGDEERRADAARVMTGFDSPPRTGSRFGEVGELAELFEMGEIWARDELSRRDRSLVVITILIWLWLEDDLRWHIATGLKHGLSYSEISEAIAHLSIYVGIPKAVAAAEVLKEFELGKATD